MNRFLATAFLLLALPAFPQDASDDDYTQRVEAGKAAYLQHGNLQRATYEFREAMRQGPGRVEAWRAQGAVFVKARDPERGIFYLNEALRRSPDNALSHYWMGMAQTNARRPWLAKHHLEKAKAGLKASDFPTEAGFQSAMKSIDELIVRADRDGAGKFDPAAVKPPARILLEYAANLYGDPAKLKGASVETGGELLKDLLLVQLYDADGRLLDNSKFTLEWGCSSGLVKKDGAILGGDKPGKEMLTVSETGSKLMERQEIVVLGPAARIEVTPSGATIAQNQRLQLEARAVDAAGNALPTPPLTWSVSPPKSPEARGLPGLLAADTRPALDRPWEPHHNSYEPPADNAHAAVDVAVECAAPKLSVTVKITIEKRRMDKLQSRAKAVTWESGSLDDALRTAAAQKKPLLVEITAGWCPFCSRFEEGPLSQTKVGDALKDWLAVQIDADAHPELVERYGVVDLPMVALLSPRGTLVGAFGNNMEPNGTDPRTTTDAFLKALEDAKRAWQGTDAEEDRRVSEARDAGKMASLARWYYQKVRWQDAEKWAREAIKADAGLTDELMPYVTWSLMSHGKLEEARKEIEGYLAARPDGKAAAQLTYQLGLALVRLKDEEKGKKVFAEVQKKWPTSVWARKAAQAARR
ncbi:MAG: thioredoxin family protein [Planctomycetes bacterium]|nr:thioredoxin family protein [Planctomycetota bacterium]